jgi:DNA-binding CsgD family transcriptional regulator
VLWCTYSRGQDYLGEPRSEAVHHVLGDDWELFTETVAHAQLGWSEGESASRLAALLREHLTPAMIAAADAEARASDVTSLMPLVRAPALVLHRRQLRHPDLPISRRLAAGLPNASLVILEGNSVAPFSGDVDAALAAIEGFLRPQSQRDAPASHPTGPRGHAHEPLSERELGVLRLLAGGFSNAEVAQELVISLGTVKTHTASIYRKLDVDNRTRAVVRARESGLLD